MHTTNRTEKQGMAKRAASPEAGSESRSGLAMGHVVTILEERPGLHGTKYLVRTAGRRGTSRTLVVWADAVETRRGEWAAIEARLARAVAENAAAAD